MKSLWFIVPAHGRFDMTRVCLRHLHTTTKLLRCQGLDAHAVVIAEDRNLATAWTLGMGTIERANVPLGRKWNDGFELAGREGVDFVVPFGTDDWVLPSYFGYLPGPHEIVCSHKLAMVNEAGSALARLHIGYMAGHGIRIIPTSLLRHSQFRPIEEDRMRACDTATLRSLRRGLPSLHLNVRRSDHLEMVDWKSSAEQLNTYEMCRPYFVGDEEDPFEALAPLYPDWALTEMRRVYQREL